MNDSPAAKERGAYCYHCGLPVRTPRSPAPSYCCHGCRFASALAGSGGEHERSANLLHLGLGALCAMNIMMLSLLLYTGGIEPGTVPIFRMVLFGLSVAALGLLLPPLITGALQPAAGTARLDLLIAGGSLAAFGLSAVHTFRGAGEIYFDTATMLPLLVTVGKLLESTAKSGASELLLTLETLLPRIALRMEAAGAVEVHVDRLTPGDLIRVRPGEQIAVDGSIVEGATTVEEASFTGEFLPRDCAAGDCVIAGTLNGNGSIVVRVERTGQELLLYRVIALVQEAWSHPSQSERLAERAAALFLPVVLAIGIGSLVTWWVLGHPAQGLMSLLSVLVVACPCTMGIATPLATWMGIARAAQTGIVVRGGDVLERLGTIDLLFLDKTGTLTAGVPSVDAIELADPELTREELLGRLAVLEQASRHPLGKAVMAEAWRLGLPGGTVSEVTVVPGGLEGLVSWQGRTTRVKAGGSRYVRGSEPQAGKRSVIEVAWDGAWRGRVILSDRLRPDAEQCLALLSAQGIQTVLLSGDHQEAVWAVAKRLRLERVVSGCSPARKLREIREARERGREVAMVGDGINDAPALAAAGTGIAVGAGMDLARQAGNVVLCADSLRQIPWLVELSRKSRRIVRANFALSFGYNLVALFAAAAGLLHPLLAALAMVASSLTVLGNSLRILRFPQPEGTCRRTARTAARRNLGNR